MDIHYTIRQIIKRPVQFILIIISLAIGIGVSTMIYAAYYTQFTKQLSGEVKDQKNLVWLLTRNNNEYKLSQYLSYRDYLEYRDNNTVFSDVIASGGNKKVLMRSGETAIKTTMHPVSSNYFNTLGIRPVIGSGFNPGDERAEQNYALISYRFWKAHFNGETSVLGKSVFIHSIPYMITGVLPKEFDGINKNLRVDVYVILDHVAYDNRGRTDGTGGIMLSGSIPLELMARLRDGVNVSQAGAEMNVRAAGLSQTYPDTNKNSGIYVAPVPDGHPLHTTTAGNMALLLLIIVLVMLLPCLNMVALLLNSAIERMHELTVRAALGATRMRIVRQLFTESLIFNLLGGCTGMIFLYWTSQMLKTVWMPDVKMMNLYIDGNIIGQSVGLCVIISVLFGLFPIFHVLRSDLASGLKSQRMPKGHRTRAILICIELAISTAVMVLATPALKYSDKYIRSELPTDNILLVSFELGLYYHMNDEQRVMTRSEIVSRVKSMHGVKNASIAPDAPYDSLAATPVFRDDDTFSAYVYANYVGQDYFTTLNIPIIKGRDIFGYDGPHETMEVIINKSMAEQYWPHQEVLGRQVKLISPQRIYTIVGVVENSAPGGARATRPGLIMAGTPVVYTPFRDDFPRNEVTVIVSLVNNNEAAMKSSILREIRMIDEQLVVDIRSLKEQFNDSVKTQKIISAALFLLGIVVFAVATMGIYAIARDAITRRMSEIGIRMMVGARSIDIVKLLIKTGIKIVVPGIVIGVLIAQVAAKLILPEENAPGIYGYIYVSALQGIIMIATWYFPIRKAINSESMNLFKSE